MAIITMANDFERKPVFANFNWPQKFLLSYLFRKFENFNEKQIEIYSHQTLMYTYIFCIDLNLHLMLWWKPTFNAMMKTYIFALMHTYIYLCNDAGG